MDSKYDRLIEKIENITSIEFSIWSNPDIGKNSVIVDPNGLINTDIYRDGKPIENGPLDPRLGII